MANALEEGASAAAAEMAEPLCVTRREVSEATRRCTRNPPKKPLRSVDDTEVKVVKSKF